MFDVLKRLSRIVSANIRHHTRTLTEFTHKDGQKDWYQSSKNNRKNEEDSYKKNDGSQNAGQNNFNNNAKPHYKETKQVREDLAVFNLSPPSSLEEIRRARNKEIKKYHSDKFIHDAEKLETSKKIMQIYNAAYDRLKNYYNE